MADSFEVFKRRAEINRKRILETNGKRIGIRTNAHRSHSSSPLSDKTNTYRNQFPHSTSKTNDDQHRVTKPKNGKGVSISQLSKGFLLSRQMEQHKSPSANSTSAVSNVSINELSKMMRATSRANTGNYIGVHSRFRKILMEFEDVKSEWKGFGNNMSCVGALRDLITFVNWFKSNKFDYILFDKSNQLTNKYFAKLQEQIKTRDMTVTGSLIESRKQSNNNDMVVTLENNKYLRPEFRDSTLTPTHSIESVNRIGRFLYAAKVINLRSLKFQVCLLMASDVRFNLRPNALLVLENKNSCYQKINNEFLRIYLHWHVYSDKPIDVNFLK